LIPETDPQFSLELREYTLKTLKTLPKLDIDYDYQYFSGLVHGLANPRR
jgi:hypothetical protein